MSNKRKGFEVKDNFVVYTPTSDDLVVAHKRSCELGVLPNSFTQGVGRMAGYLGEIAVHKYLKRSKYVGDSVFTHDLEYKKRKIEVKSKSCATPPKPHYSASVNCKKQFMPDNDVYFFTRVRKDFMIVWIVGWLPTTKLLKKATYKKRGEKDTDGFVYKTSGLHIDIEELQSATLFQ